MTPLISRAVMVACCLHGGVALGQITIQLSPAEAVGGGIISQETTPAAAASTSASADGTATVEAAKDLLTELKKLAFTRTTAGTLEEWAGTGQPAKPDKPDAPPPDPLTVKLQGLTKAVALGQWDAVGVFLKEEFPEKKDEAQQAWLHIVTSLGQGVARAGRPVPSSSSGGMIVQMSGNPNGGQMPPGFQDGNVVSPDDVLALAAQAPAELDPDALAKLGALLQGAMARGSVLDGFLQKLEAGSGPLGGADAAARVRAARLLLAAGMAVEAGPFLPDAEAALAAKQAAVLNLLALAAQGRYERDGKPEELEGAWTLTQQALGVADRSSEERTEALRRAVDLAPRVRKDLGGKWLADSFTTQPELGREILAGIGSATARGRMNFDATPREANLELQSRAVTALLAASPERAREWSQALTLMALNWMAEAKYSQERDTSSSRGPQMQYDSFGNVFFLNDGMMMQQNQQGNQPRPVPAGRMLDLAPPTAWVDAVEASLRPAIYRQLAELHLKVKNEADAFPFIEVLAKTNPDEAKELAERFIEVWGENHDPNADQRRTNRYMYIYGYNPQAEGIPLTRSKQRRNLTELADWVKKLRALPGGVNEEKLAQAFLRTHSTAEVYRMEDVEQVFGETGSLKPETLAGVLGTMRTNLGGLWRAPKVQADQKTKRSDKEIVAEVMRGYTTARTLLDEALAKYPDNWRLKLIEASLMADENNYRNEQAATTEFSQNRTEAFAVFARAAALYVEALPALEKKDQSADVFLTWFYAALGAPDLEGVKPEHVAAEAQIPLIRAALDGLPGEAADAHRTLFANALATRMSAAAPAVKYGYVSAGLKIAGDDERARPARELLAYYDDLVTEIQLQVKIDGPDTIGTEPFGVFVNIRHTKQIEREAGGFQKYLQNQNNQPGFYNFGRPLENYRDKFEEAAREALGESFDVLSATFQSDKVESRGDDEDGWRVTPYCYFLLKAKGPQTDALPPLKLSLDFIDTSGYAVLPIVSPKLPLDAGTSAPRPVAGLEVQQILDERKAPEGILGLEIKATGRGLVPPLESMLDLKPAGFVIESQEDQGLQVTQVQAGDDLDSGETAISERLWTITLKRDPAASGEAKSFTFAVPESPELKTAYFRYADADLQSVAQTVSLEAQYGKPTRVWPWVLVLLAGLGGVAGAVWRGRPRGDGPAEASAFAVPEEVNPLTVMGLLRRIRQSGRVKGEAHADLDRDLSTVEQQFYAPETHPAPLDLSALASEWVRRASAG